MVGMKLEEFYQTYLEVNDELEFQLPFTYSKIRRFDTGDKILYKGPHPLDPSRFEFYKTGGHFVFRYDEIVPFLRCKRLEQLVLWWV